MKTRLNLSPGSNEETPRLCLLLLSSHWIS